jgi:hypothetical protein
MTNIKLAIGAELDAQGGRADRRAIMSEKHHNNHVGVDVPAGYRLQPISEFDAYADVLRQINNLEKENAALKFDNDNGSISNIEVENNKMIERIRKLSHEMDDAAQHITERKLYDFADQIRVLIGLDGKAAADAATRYVCSDCGAKLRPGWTCDACGSDRADDAPAIGGEAKAVAREAIRLAVQRITEIQKRDGGKTWHLAKATLSNDLTFVAQGLIDALVILPSATPVAQALPVAAEKDALKAARVIVAYAASGMTHSGDMTNLAKRTLEMVDAALQGEKP